MDQPKYKVLYTILLEISSSYTKLSKIVHSFHCVRSYSCPKWPRCHFGIPDIGTYRVKTDFLCFYKKVFFRKNRSNTVHIKILCVLVSLSSFVSRNIYLIHDFRILREIHFEYIIEKNTTNYEFLSKYEVNRKKANNFAFKTISIMFFVFFYIKVCRHLWWHLLLFRSYHLNYQFWDNKSIYFLKANKFLFLTLLFWH